MLLNDFTNLISYKIHLTCAKKGVTIAPIRAIALHVPRPNERTVVGYT